MTRDELLEYLLDGGAHPLRDALTTWIGSSRRFAAFAEAFKTKVRKKLRTTEAGQATLDLGFELETAHALLTERSFRVVYEPTAGGGARGPDFAVSRNGKEPFLVEVTRLHGEGALPIQRRLGGVVGGKLGQFQRSAPNVLVVGTEIGGVSSDLVRQAITTWKRSLETAAHALPEAATPSQRGRSFQQLRRLSLVVVRGEGGSMATWTNPEAALELEARTRTTLLRTLAAWR